MKFTKRNNHTVKAWIVVMDGVIHECRCHPSGIQAYTVYARKPSKDEIDPAFIVPVEIRAVEKPQPPDWICGKCEQEAGKYPGGEKLPGHSRHCAKREFQPVEPPIVETDDSTVEGTAGDIYLTDYTGKATPKLISKVEDGEEEEHDESTI